jgi:shikimate dehydrogenase
VKFALIGHPVSHSLSPAIHHAAYRELGVSHEYGLLDAANETEFARALEQLRSGELAGANVTIPWKRQAFASADAKSALAERLGVCNVLAPRALGSVPQGPRGRQLVGHNTDALALEVEFRARAQGARALLIGSGGAVPAVVAACQAAGLSDVVVTARRFTPGTPEASWPGATELVRLGAKLLPWPVESVAAAAAFAAALAETGLIVQCTSAGMQGFDSGEPLAALVPWQLLPKSALAYDLIYAPLETPFLRAAAAAGLRTAHGLHMLVGQAQLAIELWLGQKPPAEPLVAAALGALAARGRS